MGAYDVDIRVEEVVLKVLLTGATGFIGTATAFALEHAGHEVLAVGRRAVGRGARPVDLAVPGGLEVLVATERPDGVIHCAAVADIGLARDDPEVARRLNADVPGELAAACVRIGARLVAVSTDQVFDGSRGDWREDDEARPLHVYGETKLAGERAVLAADPCAVIVRPALVTGKAPPGRRSSTSGLLAMLERGETPRMFTDEIRSPVAVADLARVLVELLAVEVAGRLHCGGDEVLSRYELACRQAAAAGLDPDRIGRATREEVGLAAERPADLSLDSSRLVALLGWRPVALRE
jgi:dTDP-4-dehydrorhamnose reductase